MNNFFTSFFCYLLSNSNILQMTIISHFMLLRALSILHTILSQNNMQNSIKI